MAQAVEAVDQVADLLRNARHAIAFTGAGISTPSGIPDFRSAQSGLWENVDPLLVASIHGFRQNPRAFYDWVYPLVSTIMNAHPNPAHQALACFEQMGLLKAVITQNIDRLHQCAGSRCVYELHGHLGEATCVQCFHVVAGEPIINKFLADRAIPRCPDCGGVLKPNVILYGEQLPYKIVQAAQDASNQTDLMIVVGSSLEVAPASDLPLRALRGGAKLVIINLSPTHLDARADVLIHQDAAVVLPAILRQVEVRL